VTAANSVTSSPPSLVACVHDQLRSLMGWADLPGHTRDTFTSVFEIFTRESLDQTLQPPFTGLSHINANGLPFQWVIRSAAGGYGLGFLCEIGKPGTSPEKRFRLSMERLLNWNARAEWFSTVASMLIPGEDEPWPLHWRSAIWMGVATASGTDVQLKPYLNLNRGSARERWLRVGYILKSLRRDRSLKALCAISRQASRSSWPVGLAVDILPDGRPGRLKVYFRSESVGLGWLQQWYQAVGMRAQLSTMRRCLDLFPWLGEAPYPESAFTVAVEFHPQDGEISLKTDLALTKWVEEEERILAGMRALIYATGGDPQPLDNVLEAIGVSDPDASRASVTRFVGLGCEPGRLLSYQYLPGASPGNGPATVAPDKGVCVTDIL
jgi:hypothetical protein